MGRASQWCSRCRAMMLYDIRREVIVVIGASSRTIVAGAHPGFGLDAAPKSSRSMTVPKTRRLCGMTTVRPVLYFCDATVQSTGDAYHCSDKMSCGMTTMGSIVLWDVMVLPETYPGASPAAVMRCLSRPITTNLLGNVVLDAMAL